MKLSKNIICMSLYLADIFNHCVQNGVLPDKLKLVRVILVFKLGAKNIASSYWITINFIPLFQNIEKANT